jgi:hypothetical protein
MDKIEKIKTLLNKKIERRPTFGTDPNEPWSVRAGITESNRGMLDRYLMSRGINPKFLSKYTRISHAKSSMFQQWKRDHMVEDVEIDESKTLQHTPVELRQHAINREKHMTKVLTHNGLHKEESEQLDELAPETLASYVLKTTSKDPKRAEPRKKAMSKLAKIMAKRSFSEAKKPTALEKFRAAAAEREKKHDEIQKKQSKDGSGMTSAIDRLAKHLNKEETINEVSSSEVEHHFNNWTNSEYAPYNSDAGDDNKVHQSALRYLRSTNAPKEKHEKLAMHITHKFHGSGIDEAAGISKAKETKFHKSLDTLVHKTFGKRKDELKMKEEVDITEKNDSHTHAAHYEDPKTGEWTGMNLLIAKDDDDAIRQAQEKCKEGCRLTKVERHITVKEEVEQIDELKKSTVKSWLSQQPVVPPKKPGMDRKAHNQRIKTRSKSWDRAIDRLTDRKPTSEDVFQDTQAATQTAFDMGTQADDREPTYSKKKEMSKSARMIKSLYKKNRMVKEDLYDHEKEDKSVAGYGKKPKVEKQEVQDDDQAAMVLSGGKTLTGQTRDTLEIDPVLRKPFKPDNKQQINKQQ